MRAKHGAPLSKVVLAIVLGVGRHGMAHAHGYHLSSGGSAGHAAAPAPFPPEYGPENGHGVGGRACAALGVRAMYDLMPLCHENGWRLEPYGDDRYIVTTGTSATVERRVGGDDSKHGGEDGFSGRVTPRSGCWRVHRRRAAPPPPILSDVILTNCGGGSFLCTNGTTDLLHPRPQCPRCTG